jgi:hypothetical protein
MGQYANGLAGRREEIHRSRSGDPDSKTRSYISSETRSLEPLRTLRSFIITRRSFATETHEKPLLGDSFVHFGSDPRSPLRCGPKARQTLWHDLLPDTITCDDSDFERGVRIAGHAEQRTDLRVKGQIVVELFTLEWRCYLFRPREER